MARYYWRTLALVSREGEKIKAELKSLNAQYAAQLAEQTAETKRALASYPKGTIFMGSPKTPSLNQTEKMSLLPLAVAGGLAWYLAKKGL